MKSAIYGGFINHTRHIPKLHNFRYPFFMWFLDLEEIEKGVSLGWWFSSKGFALAAFRRGDYMGDKRETLSDSVKNKMKELTGQPVSGKVFALMNLRTLGLFFSPVNFYYAFDNNGTLTHFLAEVSNIPWNERHYYCHLLSGKEVTIENPKEFKVSPFNPENNQTYKWLITKPDESIEINLGVHDERGHIFEAALRLKRKEFSIDVAKQFLRKVPAMTVMIVTRIYWQAFRIFTKGVPFIPYKRG